MTAWCRGRNCAYVHILHKDLDGNTKEGELVVNQKIAEDMLEIFRELYEADYPIEKVRLVDAYDADDEASMRDNNTSAFNFRFISHTTKVSKHGEGLAVDINTLYNPYVKEVDGQTVVEPETALPYVDRTLDFPYKIDHGDLCTNFSRNMDLCGAGTGRPGKIISILKCRIRKNSR